MSEKLTVGSTIPNFTLKDSDKNDVSPSNFKGKKLVVAFLPGAFTGVCDKEVCALQDNIDNLSKLNANIIAITVDSFFVNNKWCNVIVAETLLFDSFIKFAPYSEETCSRTIFRFFITW